MIGVSKLPEELILKTKFSQGANSTNSDGYVNYFNFTLTPHKVIICQLKRKLKTGGFTNLRLAWAI